MVKEYTLRAKWEAGKLTKEDLYVYPMPRTIGLTMEIDNDLMVKAVEAGSAADKAGIRVGDELAWLGGVWLTSMADIQWALNSAPSEGV
jgi:predicted metalloprotease with PDZ domain